MAGRLRFEAWTLPTAGTFEKIADVPALDGSTGTVELSAYTDGQIRVPSWWDGFDLLISDTAGSLIRVYDGSTIVDEFLAERIDTPIERPDVRTISGTQINGIVEKLAIYPYDYPNDITTQQDWIWAGRSVLPGLTADDLNSVKEVWTLYNGATSGTFTLTVDGQTTAAIDYNAASNVVHQRIQALSSVDDVRVSGAGTSGDPWTITFWRPTDPTTVTVDDTGLTGGTSTLTLDTAGALDPSPVTVSRRESQPAQIHGEYADPPITVVTTPLNTGSDWTLLVNGTDQFAGAQVVVNVDPGGIYSNISLPVHPVSAGDYRLVVRDFYDNLIGFTNASLTAGSYQTITIADPIVIPEGVTQVVMRIGAIAATYGDFYVDWYNATFQEGQAAATPGQIIRELVENGQNERSAFGFLDLSSFSDTVDTDGTTWPSSISFTAWFGSHLGHVLGDLTELGYEWRITPKASPTTVTHDLELFAPGGAGTDHTATAGGPAVMSGTVPAANVVKRIPSYTAATAWGAEGLYLEDTDATRLTNFGRWERVFDVEHLGNTAALQELLDEQFAEQATNLTATQATVDGDDPTVPLVDYGPGDTIWWQFPGILTKQARRVRRVSWTHTEPASYTLHASAVHTTDSAMAAAVNKLLQKYERRGRRTATVTGGAGTAVGSWPIIVASWRASDDIKAIAHYVCDGTDDDIEINAALTRASVSATGGPGRVVWLVGGVFDPSATISVPAFCSLVSPGGRFASSITPTGTLTDTVTMANSSELRNLIIGADVNGVRFSAFSSYQIVDNCRISAGVGGSAIIAGSGSTASTIRNSYLDQAALDAPTISMSGAVTSVLIIGNEIRRGDYGLQISGGASAVGKITVADNWFQSNGLGGINMDGTNGVPYTSIRNNRIHGAGDENLGTSDEAGIVLTGKASSTWEAATTEEWGTIVEGNHIETVTVGHGIWLDNMDGVQVSHNWISDTGRNGIWLDTCTETQVFGNQLWSNGTESPTGTYDNIALSGSDRNVIAYNRARIRPGASIVAGYGLSMDGTSDNNRVEHNDFTNGGTTGTVEDLGSSNTVIGATSSIDDLTDVDTTTATPSTNDRLRWDGTNWVPVTPNIDALTDVDTTTTAPVNGDLLMFDGTNWIPLTTPFYGQIYLSSTAATTISNTTSFFKLAGTTTLNTNNGFSMPANNRLTYTGTPTRQFLVTVTGGATTANNNVTLYYRLAKNGTTDAATEIHWLKKTGTDTRTFSLTHVVSLATNDYIELFVRNTTGTGNVTLQHMNMVITGIL